MNKEELIILDECITCKKPIYKGQTVVSYAYPNMNEHLSCYKELEKFKEK